jgi:hypothetical protein
MLWHKVQGAGGVGGGGEFPLVFKDIQGIGVSAPSNTFTSMALGDADTNRHIIVVVSTDRGASDRVVSSVSIGGTSAAKQAEADSGVGAQTNSVSIWSAIVPTGTTADIEVTYTGLVTRSVCAVYAAYRSDTTITTNSTSSDITEPLSVSSFDAGDYCVAAVISGVSDLSVTPTISWTGITEDAEEDAAGSGGRNVLFVASTVSGGSIDVSATVSGTRDREAALVIASWSN